MFKQKEFFIAAFFCVSIETSKSQSNQCILEGTTCTFSGLNFKTPDYYFSPLSTNNNIVEKINFLDSTIQTMPNDFCKVFPNLREIKIPNVSLEHFAPNAFQDCKFLTKLQIFMNNLTSLNMDLFAENSKLVNIDLQNNNLKEINGKMFNSLNQLNYLNLAENLLKDFPVEEFPVMEKLEHLILYSNNLTDLKELELLTKFPNLKYLHINNNLFDCERLKMIVATLKRKGVKFLKWFEETFSNKEQNTSTVDGMECYTEKIQNIKKVVKNEKILDHKNFAEENLNIILTDKTNVPVGVEQSFLKDKESSFILILIAGIVLTIIFVFIILVIVCKIMRQLKAIYGEEYVSTFVKKINHYYDDRTPILPFNSSKNDKTYDDHVYEEPTGPVRFIL